MTSLRAPGLLSHHVAVNKTLLQVAEHVQQGDQAKAKTALATVKDSIPAALQEKIFGIITALQPQQEARTLAAQSIQQDAAAYLKEIHHPACTLAARCCYTPGNESSYWLSLTSVIETSIHRVSHEILTKGRDESQWAAFQMEHTIPAYARYLERGDVDLIKKAIEHLLKQPSNQPNVNQLCLMLRVLVEAPGHLLKRPLGFFIEGFPALGMNTREDSLKTLLRQIHLSRRYMTGCFEYRKKARLPQVQEVLAAPAFSYDLQGAVPSFQSLFRRICRSRDAGDRGERDLSEERDGLLTKFVNQDRNVPFEHLKDQIERLVALNQIAKTRLEVPKFSIVCLRILGVRELQREWEAHKQARGRSTFSAFVLERGKQFENPKEEALFKRFRETLQVQKDLAAARRIYNLSIGFIEQEIAFFRGLFGVALDLAGKLQREMLGEPLLLEPLKPEGKSQAPEPALEKKKQAASRRESPPPASVQPAPQQPKPEKAPDPSAALLDHLLSCCRTNRSEEGAKQRKNAEIHLAGLCAQMARLMQEKDPLPATALILGEGALALEQMLSMHTPQQKSSHNLVQLACRLPFLTMEDSFWLREINGAEIDCRDIALLEPENLNAAQTLLRHVFTSASDRQPLIDLLQKLFPMIVNVATAGKPGDKNQHRLAELMTAYVKLLREPISAPAAAPCHAKVCAAIDTVERTLSTLPPHAPADLVANIRDNFLRRLRAEAVRTPSPQEMHSHFTTLFQSTFWIVEDLLSIALSCKQVQKDPLDFKHDFLAMLKATGLPAFSENFLAMLPEYRSLRYPATAELVQGSRLKKITKLIRELQGRSVNLEKPEGFKYPKQSAEAAFLALDKMLLEDLEELASFAQTLIKALG